MTDSASTRSLVDPSALYLVTGGAGFIGSNLVHTLVEAGARVRVIDDFSTGRRENLVGVEDRIELLERSIVDADACEAACDGADYVLHQAAIPSVPRSVANPVATHEACVTGTLNLLIAAQAAGTRRFVYAASSSAYGDTPTLPKAEEMPSVPLSPYGVAKLAGEQYAHAWWAVHGFETVSLRYFNIFGARQDPKSQYSAVIPLFVTAALEGRPATIDGDGEQTRDFTHVENAVRANLLGCRAPAEGAAGGVFNVGCGDRISINRLWTEITRILDVDIEADHGPPRAGDVRDSLASLTRSRERLGYEPVVSLEEGLSRTIEWYSGSTVVP